MLGTKAHEEENSQKPTLIDLLSSFPTGPMPNFFQFSPSITSTGTRKACVGREGQGSGVSGNKAPECTAPKALLLGLVDFIFCARKKLTQTLPLFPSHPRNCCLVDVMT